MHFSGLGSSKMEISETDFFDTLTIQNDQISYVKHVLAPLHVFFTLFVCVCGGGGGTRGSRAHNLLVQFPASAAQKWKFPKLIFFDTLTIQNDQTFLTEACFGPSSCIFHPIWVCVGGGGGKGSWASAC